MIEISLQLILSLQLVSTAHPNAQATDATRDRVQVPVHDRSPVRFINCFGGIRDSPEVNVGYDNWAGIATWWRGPDGVLELIDRIESEYQVGYRRFFLSRCGGTFQFLNEDLPPQLQGRRIIADVPANGFLQSIPNQIISGQEVRTGKQTAYLMALSYLKNTYPDIELIAYGGSTSYDVCPSDSCNYAHHKDIVPYWGEPIDLFDQSPEALSIIRQNISPMIAAGVTGFAFDKSAQPGRHNNLLRFCANLVRQGVRCMGEALPRTHRQGQAYVDPRRIESIEWIAIERFILKNWSTPVRLSDGRTYQEGIHNDPTGSVFELHKELPNFGRLYPNARIYAVLQSPEFSSLSQEDQILVIQYYMSRGLTPVVPVF